MKTNQLMVRPMGQFQVVQRTKDGMFNATALIKQWNEAMGDKKEVTKFFENSNTKEFVTALIKEENLNTQNLAYLKSRGKYNGGTWMHPYLFVKFAMWLNPTFEVKVIKFVYDKMIEFRNKSGDYAVKLSKAVQSICGEHDNMSQLMNRVHNGINYTIFGHTGDLTRNQYGTQEKMEELWLYEKHLTDLINEGFIKDSYQLMKYMGKKYRDKYPMPDCFEVK